MARLRQSLAIVFCLMALLLPWRSYSGSTTVDLALVLAVDCSYSVNDEEYRLQMQGLAEAFRSAEVIKAIHRGPEGRIGVTVMQWSSATSQVIVIPWTVIESPEDAMKFANQIASTARQTADGATSISSAIDTSVAILASSPFISNRRTIDISSDGVNNNGARPDPARNRAIAEGITINGLTIINEHPYLEHYFERHVTGGQNSFVIPANDYIAYREAIRMKLLREIIVPTV